MRMLKDMIIREKKSWLRHTLIATLSVIGLSKVSGNGFSGRTIADSSAVIGLVYLIIGLFRIVNKLHFFDSFKFGVKKLWEIIITQNYAKSRSKVGEYTDYLNDHNYEKPVITFIVIAIALIFISSILAVISK